MRDENVLEYLARILQSVTWSDVIATGVGLFILGVLLPLLGGFHWIITQISFVILSTGLTLLLLGLFWYIAIQIGS